MSRGPTIVAAAIVVVALGLYGLGRLLTADGVIGSNGSGTCRLRMERIATVSGDEVEPGLVRVTPTHIILAKGSEIAVFNLDGSLHRLLGRGGSGPGEFGQIQGLLALDRGRIAAVEANPPRLTILDIDGAIHRTQPLPVSIRRNGVLDLDDDTFVLMGGMPERSRFGHPMARISSEGEILHYFGEDEVERDGPLLGRMHPRLLAYHPDVGIAAVKQFDYTVEIWTIDGRLEKAFEREVDWF